MTTEGMNRVWSFQRSLINGMVTAREGDDVVSYRMRHGGEGGLEVIESCDLGEMGINARVSALRLLGLKERHQVGYLWLLIETLPVFTSTRPSDIHEGLVAAGDSCLEGRLGQQIGSEICTVVDDPTMRGGYGCYPIDDEGVDTRPRIYR